MLVWFTLWFKYGRNILHRLKKCIVYSIMAYHNLVLHFIFEYKACTSRETLSFSTNFNNDPKFDPPFDPTINKQCPIVDGGVQPFLQAWLYNPPLPNSPKSGSNNDNRIRKINIQRASLCPNREPISNGIWFNKFKSNPN